MENGEKQAACQVPPAVQRGKLRIYFGASSGVGKTYAMLLAAGKERAAGRKVLLAAIESHGQEELEGLRSGFEMITDGAAFDLDDALRRRPDLIAIDRLAAVNAANARHPKRWQDVQELLAAGIDVFSTLNVQDLESLSDVVGDVLGESGKHAREAVPDTVFDSAEQVILIDVPADEVLARVRAGKAGPAKEQGESMEFLRKGHLIALRELALRRTTERIQDDVLAFRSEQTEEFKESPPVWNTGSGLLACIGSDRGDERMIRGAARLANQLNTEWCAVFVETRRLPIVARERVLAGLKLAQSLGASTVVLSGQDVATAVADYARGRNISKVVCRHSRRFWHAPWSADLAERIADLAPDIDVIEIGNGPALRDAYSRPDLANSVLATVSSMLGPQARPQTKGRYLWAAGASLATTPIALLLTPFLDLANIGLLYLLVVVIITVRLGRGPSMLSAVMSVATFDFLFVPPRFSFAIYDWQYGASFVAMLLIAYLTGKLTADLRYQAAISAQRAARSRALYEFASALSGTLQNRQIFEITRAFIQETFCARATLLLPDDAGRLQYPPASAQMSVLDLGVAQWAFDHAVPAGLGTDTLPAGELFYLPLIAPMRTRGVLALQPEDGDWISMPEQQEHLNAFSTLAAIALERVHYVEVAQDTLVRMESERLRNSLLSAISHDLRTPLTSLVGLSESLTRSSPALSELQSELACGLRDEAMRMNHLVSNLLDMARIESGQLKLNLQWQELEEVVGSALHASRRPLAGRDVQIELPRDLPLVRFDAVLIERVLCNLLENTVKYTPLQAHVRIVAEAAEGFLKMCVADDGPGLPPGQEEQIFEKFERGERESAKPGVGLGLSICRAIVEAHRGVIRAYNLSPGACFEFMLPLGTPPAPPELEDADLPDVNELS